MRRTLLTAATAALCATGTLAAQTPDTTAPDPYRDSDDVRTEEIYRQQPELEVEDPIAPGEYELSEIEDADDAEDLDYRDTDVDTSGLRPKTADERTDWLMEPQPDAATEPVEEGTPALAREPKSPGLPD